MQVQVIIGIWVFMHSDKELYLPIWSVALTYTFEEGRLKFMLKFLLQQVIENIYWGLSKSHVSLKDKVHMNTFFIDNCEIKSQLYNVSGI